MARANEHWKTIIDGSPALAILHGPQAYVSPSTYASKLEHGRVVPTWNYLSVYFEGEVFVSHDVELLRQNVNELTDLHEARRDHSWQVSDAPESYIDGQLGAAADLRNSDHPGERQIAELIDKSLL